MPRAACTITPPNDDLVEPEDTSMTFELADKRVWVAGHRGMVGGAIARRLAADGVEVLTATRAECDLIRQEQVEAWLARQRPDVVVLAAAKVGGILANANYPAEFIYENLMIEANVIHAAHRVGVAKLLFLGSSCIYPKHAPQPMAEDALLTGPLEPTNEWYAIAKIAGIKLCQAYRRQYGDRFIAAMPTNLYGPDDNFDLEKSHVLPALLRKAHELKRAGGGTLELWGSGTPKREFLHVDDMADACVFLLRHYDGAEHVNIGCGEDLSIRELAELVLRVVGVDAEIRLDPSKPDGTPRKLMDVSRLRGLGWTPRLGLEDGIRLTYEWFLANAEQARLAV
jgi:GDP-L-fucose synthase